MSAANPWEAAARERKCRLLVDAFDAYLRHEKTDTHGAEAAAAIEKLDDVAWLALAKLAGCTPASAETRTLVVTTYRLRVATQRRIGS